MLGRSRRHVDTVVDTTDLAVTLVEHTAEALWRYGGHRMLQAPALARRRSAPGTDPEALAGWCAGRYPARRYPALVVGEPHGAAAHLAAALDAPWLPLVGQGRVPVAYQSVMARALVPGAPVLVLTGMRAPADPVRAAAVALARHAVDAGHPATVVHPPAHAISAMVAECYRAWLRGAGKTGNRLIVECGPLLDPWQVLRAGLVPYWCPSSVSEHAETFTWWLAGEGRYTSIEILLQPPGAPAHREDLHHWLGAACFASRRGLVEPACRRAFPRRPLAARHASRVLRRYPCDFPLPPPMPPGQALATLRSVGRAAR